MGRKIKNLHRRIAYTLDVQLYRLLREGRPLKNPDGSAVLDDQGKPIMGPPSAADLTVAARRLRNLGIGKHTDPTDEPGVPDWLKNINREIKPTAQSQQQETAEEPPPKPAPVPDWARQARRKLEGATQ
ncbi:MAG: hypothetical protein ACYC26_10125 [Phycisphaerales bacterium]